MPMKKTGAAKAGDSPSKRIDARLEELGGWRGETLGRIRALIKQADPGIVEEWKWETPVWSHDGIVCTGEAYKTAVKLTFAHGAALADPKKLFNASLEGNTRRAIDIREGEAIDEKALARRLYTAEWPDPDLLIRTSGEMRISNFLLWQLAYAELYVTPVLWPDFTRRHLFEAILEFQRRDRRFGRVPA